MALVLLSCAAMHEGSLDSRTLPVEKRFEFVQSNGSEASTEVRNAFVEGVVVRGMARNWVLQLYGRPDRSAENGWEYLDRNGNPVLQVLFENDLVDTLVIITRSP